MGHGLVPISESARRTAMLRGAIEHLGAQQRSLLEVSIGEQREVARRGGLAGTEFDAAAKIAIEAAMPQLGSASDAQHSDAQQVAIGGGDKYWVNDKVATQQAVADLFQSVALNVNNPHFLIMQGKVAKVVDMKPAEVLSMLEEAAGTQVYQNKRERTLKELEKCKAKLAKIDEMLDSDIVPALNKLRKKRGDYALGLRQLPRRPPPPLLRRPRLPPRRGHLLLSGKVVGLPRVLRLAGGGKRTEISCF